MWQAGNSSRSFLSWDHTHARSVERALFKDAVSPGAPGDKLEERGLR